MFKTLQLLLVCLFLLSSVNSNAAGLNAQTIAKLSSLPANEQQKLIEQYKKEEGGSKPVAKSVSVQSVPIVAPKHIAKAQPAKNSKSAVASKGGSLLETQYQQRYQSSMAANVKQFGYNLFAASSTTIPTKVVPDNDYLITPGDQIRIRLWGALEDSQYVAKVENDGTVNVPKIGVINVLGARLGQLDTIIGSEINKYVQGVQVNIALENLHSVEVYVVGEVAKPGLHIVPAFSTVFKGLQAAGGVNKSGTLRRVLVHRKGVKDGHLDLYSLLLNGKRDADKVLQDGDVVFVPRIGATVAVVGAVYQPGVFELKNEEKVADVLKFAGGVLPNAYTQTLYVKYYDKQNIFQVEDMRSNAKNIAQRNLHAGSVIEVPFIPADSPDAVRVTGNIKAAQSFTFIPGMMLTDVLHSVDELKPESLLDYALLHRYNPKTTRYAIQKFPLKDVFAGNYNLQLRPRDKVEILSRKQFGIEEYVTMEGSVWQPGEFKFYPGMTVEDLIALAGGCKIGARVDNIETSHVVIEGQLSTVHHQNVNLNQATTVLLQPGDKVTVPRIKNATHISSVELHGEVRYPGTYSIAEGERLSQVIERAGGFTDQAYYYGVIFTSQLAQKIQQSSIDKMLATLRLESQRNAADLAQTATSKDDLMAAQGTSAMAQNLLRELSAIKSKGRISISLSPLASFAGSEFDLELQDGDSLTVPTKPSFVTVIGSVYSPNSYLYRPGLTVAEYLEKSGGPTKKADEDYIYIQRANGEVFSVQQSGMFKHFYSQELMPGDTVVVLEDLERVPALRLFKDITEIVFRIATTAGIAFAI